MSFFSKSYFCNFQARGLVGKGVTFRTRGVLVQTPVGAWPLHPPCFEAPDDFQVE